MFKVVLAGGEAVGSVGYWQRSWRGDEINEIGWSVLPAFQRRGIARLATAQVIERREGGGGPALPPRLPVGREPAVERALPGKLGFTLLGPAEVEYPPGSVLLRQRLAARPQPLTSDDDRAGQQHAPEAQRVRPRRAARR